MRIADLYVRVSTDEQADKGYSQRNQEEVLRKYCELNSIQVRKVIYEDYSAKTFTRPEWSKLLLNLKKQRGKSELILFTKWDRFSRNAGDAYQMINELRRLGVEPQAIEQPLDLSIPENKMMLAFYLAAPEVENDRRALNVFYGMRRAKKEGRWMATAPVGYVNKTDETGRKYIAPKEPQATILRWAFEELSKGIMAADQVRVMANKKGLTCSRANFWVAIRNPVYCGKIFIQSHKDEDAYLVHGLHEPIISETLFYDVQDVLSGKKRKERPRTKYETHAMMPLRGFLTCPKCDKMLTGSGSKGQYSTYYYYHCISTCGCRFRATLANEMFVDELRKFIPHKGVVPLFKLTVCEAYKNKTGGQQSGNRQVMEELAKINEQLSKARQLLFSGELQPEDYRTFKAECDPKIARLEAKLADMSVQNSKQIYLESLLDKAVSTLSELDVIYNDADVMNKRKIISSIYPEKLCFDGKEYRTSRINEAAALIYRINNEVQTQKNRKVSNFSLLSGEVARTRIELVSKV